MACFAGMASAQGPRGADTLSAASVADSVKVLQALDAQLRTKRNDAAMWYHRAMLTWALSDRLSRPNAPPGPNAEGLGRMTDSSLHLAIGLAPTNALYHLMMGRFYLTRGNISIRILANGQFNGALDRARKGTDSLVLSEAAIEVGRINWRRYDSFKNRRMQVGDFDMARSIADAVQPNAKAQGALSANLPSEQAGTYDGNDQGSIKAVEALIKSSTMPLSGDINGAAEYERASQLFREAYAVAPTNGHAYRSLAMLLADSSRWIELESLSRAHLRKIPWDPNAWWTLGLARHRQGDSKSAALAFDSAMTYAAPAERAHLDRIERILNPNDSARISRANPAARDATAQLYWRFADPLWSRDGNESRTEFLARVVFADLRWTVEELGVRGVDTDRGDVYIRYGPPDIAAAFQPKASSEGQDIVTYWIYKSGLVFTFAGMSTYATARTPVADVVTAANMKEAQPVRWDNIAEFHVDSMPSQVARFRGGKDSVDVIVATSPPYDAIAAANEVKGAIQGSFWLLQNGQTTVYTDTSTLPGPGVRAWTHRVAPGNYVYRAEASTPASLRAARITAQVLADSDPRTGFSPSGFGISDVLLVTHADVGAAGARWSVLHAAPLVGALAHDGELTVVWENYEFVQKEGSARYSVALSIVPDRSGAARIAARIVGALANIAQIDRQSDRVIVRFERSMPYAAAFADQVQIQLGDTPPGSYTLSLEITDNSTGKKATRSTRLVLRP
jgi:GWxTD domain-containing protein